MLYSYLSIAGYVFVGALIVFFLYLVFLIGRTKVPGKKESYTAAIVASILWGLSMPASLLLAFIAVMGSGGPNTIAWAFWMAEGSLVLLFLSSLYSLSNIWLKYSMEEYGYVIRYAAVPYISIILFIIPMWVQYSHYVDGKNSTKRSDSSAEILLKQNDNNLTGDVTLDPINLFWQKFASGNYKVTIDGVRGVDQAFYFEKGELVRVGDPSDKAEKAYFIIKGGRVYAIYSSKKSFKNLDASNGSGKAILDSLKNLSVIEPFVKAHKTNNFTWSVTDKTEYLSSKKQPIEGTGYIANQAWNAEDGRGSVTPVYVKIFLDSSTNLITTMLVSNSSTSNLWGDTRFHYEMFNNIQEVKSFPRDYTREVTD